MGRKFLIIFKTACLALILLTFAIYIYLTNRSFFGGGFSIVPSPSIHDEDATSNQEPPPTALDPPLRDGNSTLLKLAGSYVGAIMNPDDKSFPRLDCPAPTPDRYEYLRGATTETVQSKRKLKYLFALDLHQCASLLPRLIGSIVETIRFLGPENCALSIVEGRSDDGTFEILKLLRSEIEGIGAKYFFTSSDLNPKAPGNDRIKTLAELRNKALRPLVDNPDRYSHEATVVFLNDVSICLQDILELIHQRLYQGADMTCAMDWTYVGQDPTFYDVWIARGMTGDTFFNIPEDGNWNSAWDLFWNDPKARDRLNSHRPFQVFSCWNGATAFTAKPILDHTIKFRSHFEKECYQGEPKLFCKDMWRHGYGKIAVVPTVNLEYSDDAARKIKALKGYVSDIVRNEEDNDEMRIEWEDNPPPNVKCMPSYKSQTWPAWDEGL
ncbi:alpha-1,3-mannosyltransferase CMT1 [Xylogone sp. PMI_703]|nr:alpha-1,3-mannosyltransferase CMT1 [Xylogone sp. PMI_703]